MRAGVSNNWCHDSLLNWDKKKHQRSAWLAFVRGIHRWPPDPPHKGPVTRKMFPFDDVTVLYIPVCWEHNTLSPTCPQQPARDWARVYYLSQVCTWRHREENKYRSEMVALWHVFGIRCAWTELQFGYRIHPFCSVSIASFECWLSWFFV